MTEAMKLVPVEPTDEMLNAIPVGARHRWAWREEARRVWSAMLQASPVGAGDRGWQTIDTAPKDGTKIDGWDSNGYRVTDISWGHHHWLNGRAVSPPSWGCGSVNGPPPNPTHWMPRPDAPQALIPTGGEG